MSSGPFDVEPSGPPATTRPAATRPPVRPVEVSTAFSLWLGAVAVYLLLIPATVSGSRASLIANQLDRPDARGRAIEPAAVQSVVNIMLASIVVGSVILAGVWLFLVLRMRAGHAWAHIVLTVFAVIPVLFSLSSLVTDPGTGFVATVLSVAQLILIGVATMMMFRPGANGYFARR
jgi:hypothetical protein